MRNKKRFFAGRLLLVTVLLLFAIAACDENHGADDSETITLFLSFVPSVQFAPMYVADERGYFADEGIDIEFEHSFNEADGVDRLAINNLHFGIISGEQVIIARRAEKPLVYVMEWFHRFPVGVVVPSDSDIESPADLRGKTVGIPGFFGASYMGFRALLNSVDLAEDDLTLQPIGFTAPEVMCERDVDAAVVYITNEPVTIAEQCYPVRVIEIADYTQLVANGLVTNEETIRNNPDLVRGMVRALNRGIADTIADPEAAFDIALEYVDLTDDQLDTQRQVFQNSVELWRSENLGATSAAAWQDTEAIMIEAGFIEDPLDDLDAAYTNDFLPESE
ncbi:MAG: ABC transporter substrate-binding protein [Chloroflexi bacterium]|nr:ABC transporter substrate-binding protein [Chloroflexota bacterium]